MILNCPISGLRYKSEFLPGCASQAHPFFSFPTKKIPAILSLWQSGSLSSEETHILFCRLLLDTEHVLFHSPLLLTPELSAKENAQMHSLASLTYSGSFQKANIELPAFVISKDNQEIENIISVWKEELENYRISSLIARQEAETRAMLERVQRAFAEPFAKGRKRIILKWLTLVGNLPSFSTLHPLTKEEIPISEYWKELMSLALDGSSFLSYPEKDLVEFRTHLEENLPLNYSQEFSLLEELKHAIERKQNYFGYSFTDSEDRSYAMESVRPSLRREDFPDILSYLNAIKANRKS